MYDEESRLKYAPTMIQLLDRCWCDFGLGRWSSGNEDGEVRGNYDIFSPRNVAHWEEANIVRARKEYVKKLKGGAGEKESDAGDVEAAPGEEEGLVDPGQPTSINDTQTTREEPYLWRLWDRIFQSRPSSLNHSNQEQPLVKSQNHTTEDRAPSNLPWFRREYDLRRHGMDIIIDFSWSRES